MASSAALTLLTAAGVLLVVALHTVIATVSVRFFRIRLATRWAPVVYTVFLVPLVYVATTIVAFGALGVGAGVHLQAQTLVVFVWGLPLALGVAIEELWMPAPDGLPQGAQ